MTAWAVPVWPRDEALLLAVQDWQSPLMTTALGAVSYLGCQLPGMVSGGGGPDPREYGPSLVAKAGSRRPSAVRRRFLHPGHPWPQSPGGQAPSRLRHRGACSTGYGIPQRPCRLCRPAGRGPDLACLAACGIPATALGGVRHPGHVGPGPSGFPESTWGCTGPATCLEDTFSGQRR